MADYFFPTVIQPIIPVGDMSALERLILSAMFEAERDDEGLYLFAEIAIDEAPTFETAALISALDRSPETSRIANVVRERLAATQDDEIELDLTRGIGWESILQDVVGRSPTLDRIVVTSSFTCSKMRPDGFGGMVTLITKDRVRSRDTTGMLCDLLDEADHGDLGVAPGHAVHSVIALEEARVRPLIGKLLEAATVPGPLTLADVTDADIREACRVVASAIDADDLRNQAEFNAANAALRYASERMAAKPL